MTAMTLINVHVKDDDKKRLQKYVESHGKDSMSEVIRSLIEEKIQIDELLAKLLPVEDVEIPEFVPKGKYVIFVNGALVAVGDTPCDLAEIAMLKFPNLPFVMKFNGPDPGPTEYVFMSLSGFYSWKYCRFGDHSYPMLPIEINVNDFTKRLNASIDTAASLCVVKYGEIPEENCTKTRSEKIFTAGGIIDAPVYSGTAQILDITFDIEFIFTPMPGEIPFKFLVGRNLFDQLDAYFMGLKQVLLLKQAEP
jgi:predicted CopG family antitoxin